jgi:hypothetical protein
MINLGFAVFIFKNMKSTVWVVKYVFQFFLPLPVNQTFLTPINSELCLR